MLKELKKGLDHFQTHTYKEHEELYRGLENQQHPHTLFITCSDSRIQPEKLMSSKPGEEFVVRNIANTVPSKERSREDLTTISGVEFAVEVLGVKQIIVCGHSNCGGCRAVLDASGDLDSSYTTHYLKPLFEVKERVLEQNKGKDKEEITRSMEEENVVEQMTHLREYQFIQNKLKKGELEIEGWHYNIGRGEVTIYDATKGEFVQNHPEE